MHKESLDSVVCVGGGSQGDLTGRRAHVRLFRPFVYHCLTASYRTRFPDIGYFRDPLVQTQLTNILFLYSVTHPDIGYRQGMHELLAPLYYAVDFDSVSSPPTADPSPVEEFCARTWVAADAWTLFSAVMRGVGRWYEWREVKRRRDSNADPGTPTASANTARNPLASHVQLNVASTDGLGLQPYVAPIVQTCNRIQSVMLKSVDPHLWKNLQGSGIEPQIYGM